MNRDQAAFGSSTSQASRQRFAFVDALRGLAALAVVLFHATEGGHVTELLAILPIWVGGALKHGDLGVAVFFVLSGFVIAHSLHKRPITLGVFARFTLRRSLRLDPPYWVAIALCIAADLLASAVVKGRPPETYSVTQLAAHLLYLQDILGFRDINAVFWTLCYEIQFYLVYALLLAIGRRCNVNLIAACYVVSVLWPIGVGPHIPNGLFPPLWHGFLLGVAAYKAWQESAHRRWFMAFAALIMVGAVFNYSGFSVVCVGTAVVLYTASVSGHIVTAMNWRWVQFLGLVSYSLYLIHNPITGATFRVGYMLTGRSINAEALWWPVSILTCITGAAVMWWAVERPSLSFARKVALKKGSRIASAADNSTVGIETNFVPP